MVFEDTPVSSARRKDAGVFFLLAMQSRSLHPVDAVHGFGCFPTSILQRKICICAHECTACYNGVGSEKFTASELYRCPNLSYNEDVLRERSIA